MSGLESFLCTHLDEFLVLAGLVTLLIELGGSGTKGPGTFYPSLHFVAVGISTIVVRNPGKICAGTKLLEGTHPFLRLELDEELEVFSALLTLLKLPSSEASTGFGGPALYIGLHHRCVGIV